MIKCLSYSFFYVMLKYVILVLEFSSQKLVKDTNKFNLKNISII